MNLELRTLHVFVAGLFALFAAICLSYGFMHLGHSIRQGIEHKATQDLETARISHMAAREHVKATENRARAAWMELEAVRTNVEKANKKALMAEYKMQAVCKKAKKVC